jgi:glutaminase
MLTIRLITLEEVGEWLLNCATNANKLTLVASAITTKKVNAPKRLASIMRWLNHVTSHQPTITRDEKLSRTTAEVLRENLAIQTTLKKLGDNLGTGERNM